MDSNNHVAESVKSASYVELADDVANHAGVHVGMTFLGVSIAPRFLG